MTRQLHISCDLDDRLRRLDMSGQHGAGAAKRCRELLAALASFGCRHPGVLARRTHHGEHRLRNCRKYDLGAGYRLVTIVKGNVIFATFAGTHDETDKWLVNHREDGLTTPRGRFRTMRPSGVAGETELRRAPEPCTDASDGYERELLAAIDDRLLREIFGGLCAVARKEADHCG